MHGFFRTLGRNRGHARHAERGQVLIMVAGGMVALLAMVALAVDLGYWRNQQRQEQSAADSAAMAGSIATYYTTTPATPAPTQVDSAAQLAATKNGYTDDGGVGNLTVKVYNPPIDGTHTADANAVEVVVTKKQTVFFAGIFGLTSQSVSARSVATHIVDTSPACFYQLGTRAGIDFNSGSLDAHNCGIEINYPLSVGGCTDASGLAYYGPVAPMPKAGCTPGPGTITKLPTPVTDPCARIVGCEYLSGLKFPSSAPANATPATTSMAAPSSPGYLYVQGPIKKNTTFGPGIYYIYGGITAEITETAPGVTIVNVDGATTFGGNDAPAITAPSTGPTAGLAFFQPSSNASPITLNGASSTWAGMVYAPSASITSNGDSQTFSELVAGDFTLNGNHTVTIDPSIAPAAVRTAETTTHAALAE